MNRRRVKVLACVGVALAVLAGVLAAIRLGAPSDASSDGVRPSDAAYGVLDDPESMLAHLSSDERRAVETATNPEYRKLLITGFYLRDRFSGDPRELRPFLGVLKEYRPLDPDSEAAFNQGTITDYALGVLARAWVQVGPVAEAESVCIEHASRCLSDPDGVIRLRAASLLTAIRVRSPGSTLPPDVQRELDEALKNDWLRFELSRQIDVLRNAAEVVGRDFPG